MNLILLLVASAIAGQQADLAKQIEELYAGVKVAEIASGDTISELHTIALLDRAGVQTSILTSPYRPMFESSGPSFVVVPTHETEIAQRTLRRFSEDGFINVLGSLAHVPEVGYYVTSLADLIEADPSLNRTKVLLRSLASFVKDGMRGRQFTISKLGIRLRKYLPSAASTDLASGYDILVFAQELGDQETVIYHSQVLGNREITPWLRVNER